MQRVFLGLLLSRSDFLDCWPELGVAAHLMFFIHAACRRVRFRSENPVLADAEGGLCSALNYLPFLPPAAPQRDNMSAHTLLFAPM